MEERCFNCDGPAAKLATLFLESGEQLENKPVCKWCFVLFEDMSTIEVFEAPVLMRGGDEENTE